MAFGRTRWLGDGYWDAAVSVNADPIRHAGFVTGCAAVNERWVTGMEARRVRVLRTMGGADRTSPVGLEQRRCSNEAVARGRARKKKRKGDLNEWQALDSA